MYPPSGYKTITARQFVNGLALLRAKRIRYQAFRVYMACFAAVAVREAAGRCRAAKAGRGGKSLQRFQIAELATLCGLSPANVKRELKVLLREHLVLFSAGEIKIRRASLDGAEELLALVRSPSRPIPVPRSVIRFIAREKRHSISKVMIAYMIRGLALERSGGGMRTKGSVKLSWIESLTGLSERSARYARAELIQLGWLVDDAGSTQWKLNRHGAYFEILLSWQPGHFAPRQPKTTPVFAPPIEDRKTLIRDQYQKAAPGVGTSSTQEGNLPAPSLKNILQADLYRLDRLEALYEQALESGYFRGGEASVLSFIAAAVRARAANGEGVRIFAALVRRGLWHHITCAQEDVARQALIRIREIDPQRFRRRIVDKSASDTGHLDHAA